MEPFLGGLPGLGAMALAAVFALSARPTTAWAHTLDLTTANVSLRDFHVEVVVSIDLLSLIAHTAAESCLVPDGTMLATMSEAELAAHVARAREALEHGARLDVDGERVALELRAFPSPQEARALAAQASAAPERRGEYVPVRFEARRSLEGAKSISVTLPNVLGAVLFTFVQPRTRLSHPGAPSTFTVLTTPVRLPEGLRPWVLTGARDWLTAAACFLLVLALLVNLLVHRKRLSP